MKNEGELIRRQKLYDVFGFSESSISDSRSNNLSARLDDELGIN